MYIGYISASAFKLALLRTEDHDHVSEAFLFFLLPSQSMMGSNFMNKHHYFIVWSAQESEKPTEHTHDPNMQANWSKKKKC